MIKTIHKKILELISYLVFLASVLGAIIAFLVTLPHNDIVVLVIAGLTSILIVIPAVIKLLRDIDAELEKIANSKSSNSKVIRV